MKPLALALAATGLLLAAASDASAFGPASAGIQSLRAHVGPTDGPPGCRHDRRLPGCDQVTRHGDSESQTRDRRRADQLALEDNARNRSRLR